MNIKLLQSKRLFYKHTFDTGQLEQLLILNEQAKCNVKQLEIFFFFTVSRPFKQQNNITRAGLCKSMSCTGNEGGAVEWEGIVSITSTTAWYGLTT